MEAKMSESRKTTLDELLGDPMVQLVMARDQVRPEDLRRMLERDRRRHADKQMIPPAHIIAACQAGSFCP